MTSHYQEDPRDLTYRRDNNPGRSQCVVRSDLSKNWCPKVLQICDHSQWPVRSLNGLPIRHFLQYSHGFGSPKNDKK